MSASLRRARPRVLALGASELEFCFVTFPLPKIISGGQTGADHGALLAARDVGIASGGVAPKGWLTENGAEETLLRGFGLVECEVSGYPARTRQNVAAADGTLLIGQYQTGGSKLTYDFARQLKKPFFAVAFPIATDVTPESLPVQEFRSWLQRFDIRVLNVAGNRESEAPGIREFSRMFLVTALRTWRV